MASHQSWRRSPPKSPLDSDQCGMKTKVLKLADPTSTVYQLIESQGTIHVLSEECGDKRAECTGTNRVKPTSYTPNPKPLILAHIGLVKPKKGTLHINVASASRTQGGGGGGFRIRGT